MGRYVRFERKSTSTTGRFTMCAQLWMVSPRHPYFLTFHFFVKE